MRTAAMVEAGQAPGYPPGWARAPREIGVQCQVCAKGSGQLSLLDPLPPGSCEHPERR